MGMAYKLVPTAVLGKHGPEVSRIGYGAMGLSGFYGTPKPDAERNAVLDTLYERGCYHWDSSDMYGDSEVFLGKWLRARPEARERIFLATKYGFRFESDGSWHVDSTPEYTKQACEKSLKNLGLQQVNLFYAHRLDGKTPVEKTMQALTELKQEGKIRYIGLCEVSSQTLRRACKVEHVDAVQLEYSPFTLDIESEHIGLLSTARELGVAVVCYSPIGRGMLGGNIKKSTDLSPDDKRHYFPRFSDENIASNLKLVDVLNSIAIKKNVTASQLALAWLLAQGDDIFPIPGTTVSSRVTENVDAAAISLTAAAMQEIRRACESTVVAGDRYAGQIAESSLADTPEL